MAGAGRKNANALEGTVFLEMGVDILETKFKKQKAEGIVEI